MTDKELDNYMKAVEPNFTSHIENGTIEMSNEYYNLLEEKMARLINENQELNLELSGYRQAILNNKEMLGLKEENEKLKKQLEDYIKSNMKLKEELSNKRKEYQDTYKDVRIEIKEYKTQQKEFIKYLEDEKDRLARECSNIYEDSLGHTRLVNEDKFDEVNDILQKYKEIIGVSDEKEN